MRRAVIGILFIISTLALFAQQQGSDRFARVVGRLVDAMNKQNYAGIEKEYDSGMATRFPLDLTTILFKNYESQYGKVTKVDSPQVKSPDQAVCVMYFERGTQDLTIYVDEQEKIKGFIFTTHIFPETKPAIDSKSKEPSSPAKTSTSIPVSESKPEIKPTSKQPSEKLIGTTEQKTEATSTSPAQSKVLAADSKSPQPTNPPAASASSPVSTSAIEQPPVIVKPDDKQQTELYPPFKGTWSVLVGGESRSGTAQRNLLLQQYAFEFSAKDSNGIRYKNEGKANEDYVGYGKDILAPANGVVVEAIDGIRENSPGLRNPYAPIGNAIVIQHANNEYSVLAYLKQGSIRVKLGDKLTRGQVIAKCGNSGNATEPVIHYHVQDSPYLQTAKGIKFYFERALVTKDGKKQLKQYCIPEIGEVINPE